MYVQRSIVGAVISAAALFAASTAQAATQTYTGSGACENGCSASATVTTGTGTVTVVLTNTFANPTAPGDLLSNFEIALPGTGTFGLTQTGGLITVQSNTAPYTTTGGPPTHWEASGSGTLITLDTFSGGKPINMIIGPPDSSGNYSNANGGITNSDPLHSFSPYINGTATFVISDASITALTALPATVTFSFGTSLNEHTVPGTPVSGVPLPPAALLFGTALVGMVILGRRRRSNGGPQDLRPRWSSRQELAFGADRG